MKLIEATYEQLCKLMELMINDKFPRDPHELWENNEELIIDIQNQLYFDKGYDGDKDNYDAIYWYFKGKNNKEEPKKEHKNEPKPIKTENKTQSEIVNRIMEKLEDSPTNWYIDFERLDNDGRKLMLPK